MKDGSNRLVVAAAFFVAVAMIAQQLAGKAIRDAFFLSVFDAETLPRVMTVASVISVVSVLGVTRLYRRHAPARVVPLFFLASAALFAVEWALSERFPRAVAAALYVHTTSFGAAAISGFWSVMSERFDPYTAKRVIGRVAGGATLGGVLGGLAAWQSAGSISIPTMLLVLSGVNVFCGAVLAGVGGPTDVKTAVTRTSDPPWTAFEETPYLVHLALLVGLVALGTAGIDYVFKATAAQTYSSEGELVSFFSLFYLGVGVVTFLLQSTIGNRLVRSAGLGVAIATLPGTIVLLGSIAFLFPGLVAMAALRGGAATIESSSYRSGYELLYTPLSPEKKRPTKTLIDVGGDKLGAACGSAIAVFLVGLIPGFATPILIAMGVGCAVVGLWISRRLAAGYVSALEESLASGRLELDAVPIEDAATRAAVERTMAALDRRTLLGPSVTNLAPTPTESRRRLLRPPGPEDGPPLAWVTRAIALLADEERADEAEEGLKVAAPAHVGTLIDALLTRRTPLESRRRIATILSGVPTQRCAQGLVFVLDAEPFEIRFRAACALSAVKLRNNAIEVGATNVYRAASRAIDRTRVDFYGTGMNVGGELSEAGVQAGRTVAYCVRLFSVVLLPEPLYLALDALGGDERGRRGTGLEYLENVLPADLETRLLPFFENAAVARYARRDDAAILDEIAEERSDGTPSLDAFKARVRDLYELEAS